MPIQRTSLKSALHKEIHNWRNAPERICPNYVIEGICRELGRKISNAERRLRKSESPNIEAVKNNKGFIVGYRASEIIDLF